MIRPISAAILLLGLGGAAALAQQQPAWQSGASGASAVAFATWRGTPLGLATGWAPWADWNGMLAYMSGSNPRTLQGRSPNVSIGVGLFPKSDGSLDACAAGAYVDNHRSIGRRLTDNRVGNAEIRLGWEANNDSYPWTAVGRSATQWKACFARAAQAIKEGGPGLRIAWHMAKRGKINARTIWPDAPADALITHVGVSHFDDAQARFLYETSNGRPDGSPVGLRAWARFACLEKGKRLEMAEWGVGRRGDNRAYIESMAAFFREIGPCLAHEGYLNGNGHDLYPSTSWPASALAYQQLF